MSRRPTVLVDTNTILGALKANVWSALCSAYAVETVLECEEEVFTGRWGKQIDRSEMERVIAIHETSKLKEQAATLEIRCLEHPGKIMIDYGEKALWTYALSLGVKNSWLLCGPDKASLRVGVRLGFKDRLVSLEKLLKDTGHSRITLPMNYTEKWHRQAVIDHMRSEGLF